jgi:hypothetical protein
VQEFPRLLLGVQTIKIGEQFGVIESPFSAGIVSHAIVDANDMLVLMSASLPTSKGGGFLEQAGRGLSDGDGPFAPPKHGRGVIAERMCGFPP